MASEHSGNHDASCLCVGGVKEAEGEHHILRHLTVCLAASTCTCSFLRAYTHTHAH